MAKKKGTEEQPTPRSELGALAPKPVVWDIGDKVFEQKPLRLEPLSDVMEEITDIVIGQGQGAIFDQIVDAAAKGDDAKDVLGPATMPVLVRTVVSIPRRLPKIIAMLLPDAKEEYLGAHLRPRMALQIIKTFIEQNEIGALIQDFFDLVSTATQSVNQATAETEEEAEMETVRDSDSETAEEIEEV